MQAKQTRLKGYIVTVKDGDETTETHYAVKPNGAVLFCSVRDMTRTTLVLAHETVTSGASHQTCLNAQYSLVFSIDT